MMVAKCDRCGKETDARALSPESGWTINRNVLALNITLDLCSDCVEGLRAYLRGEDL